MIFEQASLDINATTDNTDGTCSLQPAAAPHLIHHCEVSDPPPVKSSQSEWQETAHDAGSADRGARTID
jgi:hypothetical protein